MFALITLAFTTLTPQKGLSCTKRKLAGSFFNRHAITPLRELSRFVRKQFQVLFHWVSHPSFNLSLAVLVHYRSLSIFSLGGWFPQIPTRYVPHGTWDTSRALFDFAYKTFTLYGRQFHAVPLSNKVSH